MSELTDRERQQNHEAALVWLGDVEQTADKLLDQAAAYQKTLFGFYVAANEEERLAILARSDKLKEKLRITHAALLLHYSK